jgi:hypothetical protein
VDQLEPLEKESAMRSLSANRIVSLIVVATLIVCLPPRSPAQDDGKSSPTPNNAPRPLPRKDAFFGLHLDLHPQKSDTTLGADMTEENIAGLLARAKPDCRQLQTAGGFQSRAAGIRRTGR